MAITCCNGCLAPKRNGERHAVCPEYKAQKEAHDAKLEQIRKDKSIQQGISDQKLKGVRKAYKRRRNN